jgi:hypothetical protein
MVCAGGLGLALVAGCQSIDIRGFLALQSDGAGRERVIAGSIDSVAESVRASLGQLGLSAVVTTKGETVRVESKTGSGAGFAVVLTRDKGRDGEQTRLHIEWEGPRDDQLGLQLLGQLDMLRRR